MTTEVERLKEGLRVAISALQILQKGYDEVEIDRKLIDKNNNINWNYIGDDDVDDDDIDSTNNMMYPYELINTLKKLVR